VGCKPSVWRSHCQGWEVWALVATSCALWRRILRQDSSTVSVANLEDSGLEGTGSEFLVKLVEVVFSTSCLICCYYGMDCSPGDSALARVLSWGKVLDMHQVWFSLANFSSFAGEEPSQIVLDLWRLRIPELFGYEVVLMVLVEGFASLVGQAGLVYHDLLEAKICVSTYLKVLGKISWAQLCFL